MVLALLLLLLSPLYCELNEITFAFDGRGSSLAGHDRLAAVVRRRREREAGELIKPVDLLENRYYHNEQRRHHNEYRLMNTIRQLQLQRQ